MTSVVKKHIFLQIFASLAIVACVAPCQRLSEAAACNLAQAWAKEHSVFRNIQKRLCSYFSRRGDEAFICVDGITSTSRSTPKRAGRHWTELWVEHLADAKDRCRAGRLVALGRISASTQSNNAAPDRPRRGAVSAGRRCSVSAAAGERQDVGRQREGANLQCQRCVF